MVGDSQWNGLPVSSGYSSCYSLRSYRKSLDESRNLTNYALLILLDEGVCDAQRKALADFVHTIDARNAADLGAKVNLATTQLAARLGHTLLGTAGVLWKLKQTSDRFPG
jgi:hypothetical protein